MDKEQVLRCIESAYEKVIEQAFKTAVENSMLGDSNAESRFHFAVETASKVKDKLTKSL